MADDESFEAISEALRFAAATLRNAEIPFMLGGSLAVWARGGPRSHNDLDLMVKPADAEAALQALVNAGLKPERPPEEWLLKAWHGEVMIDLIFHPAGIQIDDELIDQADVIPVLAVAMPVMDLEDVLAAKLNSLTERTLDYSALIAMARPVREQIDWRKLRSLTLGSPFAAAFLALAEGLDIAPVSARTTPPSRESGQEIAAASRGVRVVTEPA